MSRPGIIVLTLCLVFAIEYVNSSIIVPSDLKVGDVKTREIPKDEILKDKVEDVPIEVAPKPTAAKCAEIGQFCMNHSDCCTYSCLGYMKRCVSGTG